MARMESPVASGRLDILERLAGLMQVGSGLGRSDVHDDDETESPPIHPRGGSVPSPHPPPSLSPGAKANIIQRLREEAADPPPKSYSFDPSYNRSNVRVNDPVTASANPSVPNRVTERIDAIMKKMASSPGSPVRSSSSHFAPPSSATDLESPSVSPYFVGKSQHQSFPPSQPLNHHQRPLADAATHETVLKSLAAERDEVSRLSVEIGRLEKFFLETKQTGENALEELRRDAAVVSSCLSTLPAPVAKALSDSKRVMSMEQRDRILDRETKDTLQRRPLARFLRSLVDAVAYVQRERDAESLAYVHECTQFKQERERMFSDFEKERDLLIANNSSNTNHQLVHEIDQGLIADLKSRLSLSENALADLTVSSQRIQGDLSASLREDSCKVMDSQEILKEVIRQAAQDKAVIVSEYRHSNNGLEAVMSQLENLDELFDIFREENTKQFDAMAADKELLFEELLEVAEGRGVKAIVIGPGGGISDKIRGKVRSKKKKILETEPMPQPSWTMCEVCLSRGGDADATLINTSSNEDAVRDEGNRIIRRLEYKLSKCEKDRDEGKRRVVALAAEVDSLTLELEQSRVQAHILKNKFMDHESSRSRLMKCNEEKKALVIEIEALQATLASTNSKYKQVLEECTKVKKELKTIQSKTFGDVVSESATSRGMVDSLVDAIRSPLMEQRCVWMTRLWSHSAASRGWTQWRLFLLIEQRLRAETLQVDRISSSAVRKMERELEWTLQHSKKQEKNSALLLEQTKNQYENQLKNLLELTNDEKAVLTKTLKSLRRSLEETTQKLETESAISEHMIKRLTTKLGAVNAELSQIKSEQRRREICAKLIQRSYRAHVTVEAMRKLRLRVFANRIIRTYKKYFRKKVKCIIKIQSQIRRYRARKQFVRRASERALQRQNAAATKLQSVLRGGWARKHLKNSALSDTEIKSAMLLQRWYRRRQARVGGRESLEKERAQRLERAVLRVQAWFRGSKGRRHAQNLFSQQRASDDKMFVLLRDLKKLSQWHFEPDASSVVPDTGLVVECGFLDVYKVELGGFNAGKLVQRWCLLTEGHSVSFFSTAYSIRLGPSVASIRLDHIVSVAVTDRTNFELRIISNSSSSVSEIVCRAQDAVSLERWRGALASQFERSADSAADDIRLKKAKLVKNKYRVTDYNFQITYVTRQIICAGVARAEREELDVGSDGISEAGEFDDVHMTLKQKDKESIKNNQLLGDRFVKSDNNILKKASVMKSFDDATELLKFLSDHHRGMFKVFNLSNRMYDPSSFSFQYNAGASFPPGGVPRLKSLLEVCEDAKGWLEQDTRRVALLLSESGAGRAATVAAVLLNYLGVHEDSDVSLGRFAYARASAMSLLQGFDTGDSSHVLHMRFVSPSQRRYVHYVTSRLSSVRERGSSSVIFNKREPSIGLPTIEVSSRILGGFISSGLVTIRARLGDGTIIFDHSVAYATDSIRNARVYDRISGITRFECPSLFFCGDAQITLEKVINTEIIKTRNKELDAFPSPLLSFWLNTAFESHDGLYLGKEDLDGANKDTKHMIFEKDLSVMIKFRRPPASLYTLI